MRTPVHFQRFNDKVKLMNQTNSRELRLTADEARALHADMFNVLAELAAREEKSDEELVIVMDPGPDSL